MNINKLQSELSGYGTVEVFKVGYVFSLLITGSGLAKAPTVLEIGKKLTEVQKMYPIVEVATNNDHFFMMVLRQR